MTARVLNPMVFSEFCKLRGSPTAKQIQRNLTVSAKVKSIKRDLFGSSSSTETKRIFEDEIKQHQDNATKKWGFDFRNGSPSGSSSTYVWERVVVSEMVPEMYTLTRAAHVREIITESSTEQDILMDERSSKENSLEEILNFSFKAPISPTSQAPNTSPSRMMLSCHTSLGKRQPRITEYMKERKRLSQPPKKVSPSKRQRTSSGNQSSLSFFVTSKK